MLKTFSWLPLALLALLSGCAPFPDGPVGGSLALVGTVGATGADSLEFLPYDVAIASGGRMFVTDPGNGRVLIFDSPGQVTGTPWIIPGMNYPDHLAIDISGKIYVTSSNNNQIQVFNPDLSFIRKWGTGPGDIGPRRPVDVAVGSNGQVYMLETSPSPIVRIYQADGTFLGAISLSTDSDFRTAPTCLTVDSSGNVYVSYRDIQTIGLIRKYASNGLLISTLPLPNGALTPTVMAVGPGDELYIGDSRGLITRLNVDGTVNSQVGRDGSGNAYMARPEGLVISADRRIYVADSFFVGVYTFLSDGTLLNLREPRLETLRVTSVKGMTVDQSGFLYLVDQFAGRLQIYSDGGAYLKGWGRTGARTGYFYYPQDVAVDNQGSIYVADRDNGRVQVFDEQGRFVRLWSDQGVTSVAATSTAVFTMSSLELRKRTPNGALVDKLTKIGNVSFLNLEAVAVDKQKRIYLADGGTGKIHVLTDSLTVLKSLDFVGRRDAFDNIDIAVDSKFRVYVADNQDGVIAILDADGHPVKNWNPFEPGRGPTSVAVDPLNDHVYVARVGGPVYEYTALE